MNQHDISGLANVIDQMINDSSYELHLSSFTCGVYLYKFFEKDNVYDGKFVVD